MPLDKLSSRTPAPATASSAPDPIRTEIVRGALRSAQLEMNSLIERTAMAPIIREKQDYFTGLVDKDLNLLIGTKFAFGTRIVAPVLEHFPASEMRPGDIYLYNDCYGTNGAIGHMPDLVFVTPVFHREQLEGYVFSWAHFIDIGGLQPGSMAPNATDIFHEGIIIPVVRFARGGEIVDDIFRLVTRNTRFPDVVRGDLMSLSAAIQLGVQRMQEILERYGADEAHRIFGALIAETEATVRTGMKQAFPSGRYRFADVVDDDGLGSGPVCIRMTLESDGERFILDCTETDDQARGPINFLMSSAIPGMLFGLFLTADNPHLLPNQGLMRAIDEVRLRPGSLLQPNFPAPLSGRSVTSRRVHSTCFGLLSVANVENAHAGNSAHVLGMLSGQRETGKRYIKLIGLAAGQGARPFSDGLDAIYSVAQRNLPVEFVEIDYPIRIRTYALRADSGGPGRWRGGAGIVREFELVGDKASVMLRMTNSEHPPFGIAGGMSGRPGRFVLNPGTPHEQLLPLMADAVPLKQGDVLRIETPGGGGVGHPYDRPSELVLRDVLSGIVSVETAREDYGVIVDVDAEGVDIAGTDRLRADTRAPTKLVHRRGYFDEQEWYEASLQLTARNTQRVR